MKNWIAALAVFAFVVSSVQAAGPMSEQQARAHAIKILMGDPYGTTTEQVSKNIKDVKLVRDGRTLCGKLKSAVWQFHVVVPKPVNNPDSPIDGYLSLDASSGKMLCANLPMLN